MLDRPPNAFFRSLSDETFAVVAPQLKRIELKVGDKLCVTDDEVTNVYFPAGCLLSLILATADGGQVESNMAGLEGPWGLIEVLGGGVSVVDCDVQIDGPAHRLEGRAVRQLMARPDFAKACMVSIDALQIEARRSHLCRGFHPVEARLARWLLDSSERTAGRDPLPLTQAFLGAMLGVNRTTVTGAVAEFQRVGLVKTVRGRIHLLDRAALEGRACECRPVLQMHRERLGLTPSPVAS